jgi:ADP-L-glycero-D-manno-heptose 6-epimerase
MILITGAAGFIGSNIVAELNEQGRTDLVLCDLLRQGGKWHNLRKRAFVDIVPPPELAAWLRGPAAQKITAVVHMGANSSTMATDGDEIMQRNFRFSNMLLDWTAERAIPFIYASSAATYGEGEEGYDDNADFEHLKRLRPLNLYGWSKHIFDQAVVERRKRGEAMPPLCVGLKFFNVYGPNEQHKGAMQSVVSKIFRSITEGEQVRLFRSHRPEYADGEQMRDFVYVRDICRVITHLLARREGFGLFNVGSGEARTWLDLARAVFAAMEREASIDFIDMPQELRAKYQYYTKADITRLRAFGYNAPMQTLEAGVTDYVRHFLSQADSYR